MDFYWISNDVITYVIQADTYDIIYMSSSLKQLSFIVMEAKTINKKSTSRLQKKQLDVQTSFMRSSMDKWRQKRGGWLTF